jgi:hypothetical protein
MIVYNAKPEISDDVARAVQVIAPATAYFIANLSRILDISQLSKGDDEEDFFVPVPANRLHEVSLRIADLEFDVQERFGVGISVLPIPMAT